MSDTMLLNLLIFVVVAMIVIAIGAMIKRMDHRVADRIDEIQKAKPAGGLNGNANSSRIFKIARETLPKVGKLIIPTSDEERTLLQTRLIQCGFYRKNAMYTFLATKLILVVAPVTVAFLLMVGLGLPRKVLIYPAILGIGGMIGPSFIWITRKKSGRSAFVAHCLTRLISWWSALRAA